MMRAWDLVVSVKRAAVAGVVAWPHDVDIYGGSRRLSLVWALPTASCFPPAIGSRQPRHNATRRSPKQTAAPASADVAGGAFRRWPATTTIAPASAATA